MKILFTGGGTLGSLTPLLAIAEELRARGGDLEFIWIGTSAGPERALVEAAGIPFSSIVSAKFRRYFDLRNFSDPFLLVMGIIQSARVIRRFKPDVIVNAGSYIGVPVLIAGSLLGSRGVVLQLDLVPSLSNQLAAGFVDAILAGYDESAGAFSPKKTRTIGIPVRAAYRDSTLITRAKSELLRRYGIRKDFPLLLVLGGGTGAEFLNTLVRSTLSQLCTGAHVLLVTGKGKGSVPPIVHAGYTEVELLEHELPLVMARADAVATRAGMGTLAELCALQKPIVIIPIPGSHQEANARFFEKNHAARVLQQDQCTPDCFLSVARDLLYDADRRALLARGMEKLDRPESVSKIAALLSQYEKKK